MTVIAARRALLLASVCAFAASHALAASFTVTTGTTDTGQKTVAGTDAAVVEAGGVLSTTTNPAINWNGASTGLTITNSGTIRSTNASGRAIGTSGAAGGSRSVVLTNNTGGLIESADDAVRINSAATAGTIRVENAGIIRTTGGGQALDFDTANGGAATIIINNAVTGELRAIGQDAVRPGQNSVINNAGLIIVDEGMGYDSRDGVDFQDFNSGTVNNLATGTISGMRHGITVKQDVVVTNAAGGLILGRNGSGVGSDGTGTVTNRGTIRGTISGLSPNGDGDGVDIDGVGTINNYGLIEGIGAVGVDSGGSPNGADGVAMGGGVINNFAGGTIRGGNKGILIDNGSDGSAAAVTTITNAGTITGLAGPAIRMVGGFNDVITNSGTISATGGSAIDMGAGNDTLNLQTGSVITGLVDGGAGTDVVNLTGGGTFGGGVNFETLDVQSGAWTLTGTQGYALTTVRSGATAQVNGALSGALTVASGGRLRGTGSVSSLTIAGVIAPGNSIGTTTISGNLAMASTATYEAEVNAAGDSDRINVGGSASVAGTLSVLAEAGTYNPVTTYTILSATGGVTGGFTTVTSNLAFLTPQVSYASNAVTLNLLRNDVQFEDVAANSNQAGAGAAISGLGVSNALYQGILPLGVTGARAALDVLSGDIHGNVRGALFEGDRIPSQAAFDRLTGGETGAWARVYGANGRSSAEAGRTLTKEERVGFAGGADIDAGDWRLGVMGVMSQSELDTPARPAEGELEGGSVSLYAGRVLGSARVRVGAGVGRYDVSTSRFVGVAGFSQTLAAAYDAETAEVFGEIGKVMGTDAFSYEPFAGLTWRRVETDGFSEGATGAALSAAAFSSDVTTLTAGVRMRGQMDWGGAAVVPHLTAAVRYASDFDDQAAAQLAFSVGGSTFSAVGGWRDKTAALIEAGADIALGDNTKAWIGYSGRISKRTSDHGLQLGLKADF